MSVSSACHYAKPESSTKHGKWVCVWVHACVHVCGGGGDTSLRGCVTPSLREVMTALFCQRMDGCSIMAAEEAGEVEETRGDGVSRRKGRFFLLLLLLLPTLNKEIRSSK